LNLVAVEAICLLFYWVELKVSALHVRVMAAADCFWLASEANSEGLPFFRRSLCLVEIGFILNKVLEKGLSNG